MTSLFRAFMYGLLSPFVFVAAGAVFEENGRNSWREAIAGGIAIAAYLALCEFLLLRRGSRKLRDVWPTLAGAAIPVVLAFALIAMVEKSAVVYMQGVPLLAAGVIGIALGASIAMRPQPASTP